MSVTDTWNAAFEASPAGSESPTLGDDKIRQHKRANRERMEREHNAGVSETNSKHGWHKEGSARAFVNSQASLTTYNDVDTTAIGGDATIDEGRLLFDRSQALLPYLYDAGWQPFIREIARVSIQGTLAAGNNVIPGILFPRKCTIVKITAMVGTVPTTDDLIVDINKNGSTTIFTAAGSRLTISADDSQGNVTTGMSGAALAADDYLTMDIDQVGDTVAGADFSMTIETVVG